MSRSDQIDAALNQTSVYRGMARTAELYGFKALAATYEKEAKKCGRWAAKQ